MNLPNEAVASVASVASVALAPPPQPPQPHRPSTSCDRHPDERFTGFCPSCLCERLSVLEQHKENNPSSSRKPPLSAAALKAIFKPLGGNNASGSSSSCSRPGLLPELRRTKSFSASKNYEGFSGAFEPQRRSCDVRVRNTLWSLFNEDDERNPFNNKPSRGGSEIEEERRNSSVKDPVFEFKEEEEEKTESESIHEENELEGKNEKNIEEIVQEEIVEEEEEEVKKPMKDYMEVDSQAKKPFKEIAGSFWSAASVFSKKLQKWRQKQKLKKQRRNHRSSSARLPVEKPISSQLRDTQSEIADYGYGRRSCDTDPRFSIDAGRFSLDAGRFSVDAGRISVDDPRYSFDEPRASWDGYLIGRTTALPPRMPSMLSVVEDSPVRNHHVVRTDTQIPVEEPPPPVVNDENVPGGSEQTREYYSDSSSRRRKSLDRSSSIRKTAAAVVAEMDELKAASNAKVSPLQEREGFSNSNSLKDDCSMETFEIGFRDNASVIGNVGDKKGGKKSRRWSWNIFGLIHRRSANNKYEEEDERFSSRGGNGVERSYSESWNGDIRRGFDPKMLRSNSSVSWRSSASFGGGGGGGGSSMRKSNVDSYNNIGGNGNGSGNGKKRDGFVMERNRSARYSSPNKIDNGLLRFYLTPMRGSRRGGWGKTRPNPAHSFARSVMRLY